MQSNHDSIGYSSGFSTPCDKPARQEYELNAVCLNERLKYEEEITKLKSELDEINRSNENLKQEKEDVCKENKNLKSQLTYLQLSSPVDGGKCRNCLTLAKNYKELLEEVGELQVERDMRVRKDKNEANFKSMFSKRKNAEGVVIDKTSEKCHALRSDNVCSAPTERQMDTLGAITADAINLDDESLGAIQNETHSHHLHHENIRPRQDEASSDKALRTPSFVPESETVDEKTRRLKSLGTLHENSSTQEQEQQEQNGSENDKMNISNSEPNLNYHKVLGIIGSNLLRENVSELKDWAGEKHSNERFENASAADILTRLDQEGVINSSDLRELRSFLESIGRFDLVYTIDLFEKGEYRRIVHVYNLQL